MGGVLRFAGRMRHHCLAATRPLGCGITAQDRKQRMPLALRPSTIPQRLWGRRWQIARRADELLNQHSHTYRQAGFYTAKVLKGAKPAGFCCQPDLSL
jgi:hypothetical protein